MSHLIPPAMDAITISVPEALIFSDAAASAESVITEPADIGGSSKRNARKKYRKKTKSRNQLCPDISANQTSDPSCHMLSETVTSCSGGGLLDTTKDRLDGIICTQKTSELIKTVCLEETAAIRKGVQNLATKDMPQMVQNSELLVENSEPLPVAIQIIQHEPEVQAKASKSARKRRNSKAKAESRLNPSVSQPLPVISDESVQGVVKLEIKPQQEQWQQQSKNISKKPNKNQKLINTKQNHPAGLPRVQSGARQPPGHKLEKLQQREETTSDNVSNNNNNSSKKPYGLNRITPLDKPFENYWNAEDVQHGLKRGQLIQGAIRINPRNFEECFLPHPDGKSDVCISGMHDRNRALNGDIVCVLVYPKENWKTLIEDLNEMENYLVKTFGSVLSRESSAAVFSAQSQSSGANSGQTPGSSTPHNSSKMPNSSQRQKQSVSRYTMLKDIGRDQDNGSIPISPVIKNLFSNNGNRSFPSTVTDMEIMEQKINVLPEDLLVRTGKVVYISEKVHGRACVGRIKPVTDKKWPNTAFFSPNDSRLPRILLKLSECPDGFRQRPEDFENTLFIARITDWERTLPFAQGCLARSLGEAGEIEPETEGMLIEYELDFGDFSGDVLACLPQALPWRIQAKEFEYRRDLRNECIFTIDPSTARDLDDALSCRPLEPGFFEVGVHIADVSFFVQPETSLDAVAAHRCTSVYLVQKVVPMLPRLLCEELCSLNAGEDRLCFSVIWKMTENGEIVDQWFGRTVINSCVKLSYEHAQGFISEPDREWTAEEIPPIYGCFTIDTIQKTVLMLNRIAVNLRKKRFDGGALRLDQVKLQFSLNKETGLPDGWYVYEQRDSNRLVEEFMLLANMATAHRIKSAFPKFAILRRHPQPQLRLLENVISICQSLGIAIDGTSAGALQRSLYLESTSDEEAKARLQVLTSLCARPMKNALYFCTGVLDNEEEYAHYALNVPLYTHFTSPIRRYPDIMVHRLLAASLGYSEQALTDPKKAEDQCDLCNKRKTSAKRVSEMSAELFFAIFLKHCGPLDAKGMVTSVLDKSFDVLVLSLGIIKRAYCEKLPLQSFQASKVEKRPLLELVWKADEHHPTEIIQELTLFTPVCCRLVPGDDLLRWSLEIKHPLELYQ